MTGKVQLSDIKRRTARMTLEPRLLLRPSDLCDGKNADAARRTAPIPVRIFLSTVSDEFRHDRDRLRRDHNVRARLRGRERSRPRLDRVAYSRPGQTAPAFLSSGSVRKITSMSKPASPDLRF